MSLHAAAFDALPLQVWTSRPDGTLDFVNRAVTDYFCATPDRLLSNGWKNLCHPHDLVEAGRCWSHSLLTGDPYEVEFRLLRGADRQYRWHLARALPVRDGDDAILGWVGTNTDVDAIKRSQEQGQALSARARGDVERLLAERAAVLGNLSEGVVMTDATGRITFANRRAEALHGCALLDAPPERYAQACSHYTASGEPCPPDALPMARAITGDEAVHGARWRIRRGDGTDILVEAEARPLHSSQGHKLGAVMVLREVPQPDRPHSEY
ncbi:PAS domain-containing protein [Lysobacter sp. A3-1-A15]|uniref:PAS domain-containing protein n=1 Tax=Novilysobacter viscosus TaxID=3098602 RepID=UPI002EDA865E